MATLSTEVRTCIGATPIDIRRLIFESVANNLVAWVHEQALDWSQKTVAEIKLNPTVFVTQPPPILTRMANDVKRLLTDPQATQEWKSTTSAPSDVLLLQAVANMVNLLQEAANTPSDQVITNVSKHVTILKGFCERKLSWHPVLNALPQEKICRRAVEIQTESNNRTQQRKKTQMLAEKMKCIGSVECLLQILAELVNAAYAEPDANQDNMKKQAIQSAKEMDVRHIADGKQIVFVFVFVTLLSPIET